MTLEQTKLKQIGILEGSFELEMAQGNTFSSGSITDFFLAGDKALHRFSCAVELFKSGYLNSSSEVYDSNMKTYTMTQAEAESILEQARQWAYGRINYLSGKISSVMSASTIEEVESINY